MSFLRTSHLYYDIQSNFNMNIRYSMPQLLYGKIANQLILEFLY